MTFEAHNAGIGDCFSIEENNKLYVVDGGNANNIIQDFIGKSIDVCIITHNDRDHTHGILKMLEENSGVEIKEIWLPGIWQPIIDYVHHNPKCLFDLIEDGAYFDKNSIAELIDISGLVKNTTEDISVFFDVVDNELQFIELYELHNELIKINPEKYFNAPNIDLNRILGIFALAIERSCNIKFFFPEEIKKSNIIKNYPFRMLNSSLVCNLKTVSKNNFNKLLFLSKNNRYSLVFEYVHCETPIVLFTADSDLYFVDIKEKIEYGAGTVIITAPHHGSESNCKAYMKLKGKKITWVKSGGSMKCVTGKTFKTIPHFQKFCNKCVCEKQLNFVYTKVLFKYENKTWFSIGENHCLCCVCSSCRSKLRLKKLKKLKFS